MKLIGDNLIYPDQRFYPLPRLTVVALIFIVALILVSLVQLMQTHELKKIKSRKTFSLMIWTLLISITVYFALPSASVELVWLISIPVSLFPDSLFCICKKRKTGT